VLEARAAGADAVLLIVCVLDQARLVELLAVAREVGMAPLVEVHDETEAELAVSLGVRVIGINHRDLRTLAMDTSLTERLRPRIPSDRVLVAESGIRTAADVRRLATAGADAILVGETLMRHAFPGQALSELLT
jgi:indole-3-glycerol phosphate synthase